MTVKPGRPVGAIGALGAALLCCLTTTAAAQEIPRPRLKPVPPVVREAVPLEPAPSRQVAPPAAVPDIAAACLATLRASGADAVAAEPFVTERGCGIDDPVVLRSVRSGTTRVTFSGGPMLSCAFAVKLAQWSSDVVSPVARHHLGAPVDRVLVGPGYVCRGRNGATTGKLSEHAMGKAVDILGLVLGDGATVMVIDEPKASGGRKSFLKAIRTSACGYFTTVLGPGADDAHADHFHLDIGRHGKTDRYRICQ